MFFVIVLINSFSSFSMSMPIHHGHGQDHEGQTDAKGRGDPKEPWAGVDRRGDVAVKAAMWIVLVMKKNTCSIVSSGNSVIGGRWHDDEFDDDHRSASMLWISQRVIAVYRCLVTKKLRQID